MRFARRDLFVFLSAIIFFAVPFLAYGDFVFTVEPTLSPENAGVLYQGYEGIPEDYASTTIRGNDISAPSDTWKINFLDPPSVEVPEERGVYLFYRSVSDPTPENGPEGDILVSGNNYELVHAPIPAAVGAGTSTETVSFPNMPKFGDSATPAGSYSLYVFTLPENKTVYDPDTDSLVEEPYTDADLIKWFEWNYGTDPSYTGDIPDIYPPESIDTFDFGYSARTEVVPTPGITAPVIIIPGILGSQYWHGQWIIDPVLHVYDNFIDTLIANGYQNGVTLFTFPYDWRNSNIDSAALLKDKIEQVKGICGCDKVDIVAHSMGGLVAREYIEGGHYGDDVRRLVFLGTPHLGAPEDYLTWEGGEMLSSPLTPLLKLIFAGEALERGFLSLFDYVHNKPIYSVQELLPVYDYLENADGTARPGYSDTYPRNIFLEQLTANVQRLYDSKIEITNIVGNVGDGSTVSTIRTVDAPDGDKWADGYPENFDNPGTDQGLEWGKGDGTVPFGSASYIASSSQSFAYGHTDLPTYTASSTFEALTLEEPTTVVTNSLFHRMLFIRDFSPVDIVVTAPDGKKVGKDFSTGDDTNEIPGAFYSGSDSEDEFITIPEPEDGTYTISTQGTGDGAYTLEASYANDATTTSQFISGTTSSGETADQAIDVDASSDEPSLSFIIPEATSSEPEPEPVVESPIPESPHSSGGGGPIWQSVQPLLVSASLPDIPTSTASSSEAERTSAASAASSSYAIAPSSSEGSVPKIHGEVEGTSTEATPPRNSPPSSVKSNNHWYDTWTVFASLLKWTLHLLLPIK